MKCDFQVGDAVVYIGGPLAPHFDLLQVPPAVVDEIYHIREVAAVLDFWGEFVVVGVRLREMSLPMSYTPTGECCFDHRCFRKLLTVEDFMSKGAGVPVNSGDKVVEHV